MIHDRTPPNHNKCSRAVLNASSRGVANHVKTPLHAATAHQNIVCAQAPHSSIRAAQRHAYPWWLCLPISTQPSCGTRECSLTLSHRQRVADALQTLSFALLCTPTVLATHTLTRSAGTGSARRWPLSRRVRDCGCILHLRALTCVCMQRKRTRTTPTAARRATLPHRRLLSPSMRSASRALHRRSSLQVCLARDMISVLCFKNFNGMQLAARP